jgi:hypothetical protein
MYGWCIGSMSWPYQQIFFSMAELCGENHQEAEVSLALACRKCSRCKKKTVDAVLNDGEEGQCIN